MEFIKYLSIFLIIINQANAQSSDTVKSIIYYKFKFLSDSTKKDSYYSENMMLCLGEKSSIYKSYDYFSYDSARRAISSSPEGNLYPTPASNVSMSQYIKLRDQKINITQTFLLRSYLIYDIAPKIIWKIKMETKNIKGLICQKAICEFKGRKYEAWFCFDLAYNNGPWKLGELPGLIVEARDLKNEIIFEFLKIDTTPKLQFIPMPKGIKTNPVEFDKLFKVASEDPITFMSNSGIILKDIKLNGNSIPIQTFQKKKTTAFNKIEINNKMELSYKCNDFLNKKKSAIRSFWANLYSYHLK